MAPVRSLDPSRPSPHVSRRPSPGCLCSFDSLREPRGLSACAASRFGGSRASTPRTANGGSRLWAYTMRCYPSGASGRGSSSSRGVGPYRSLDDHGEEALRRSRRRCREADASSNTSGRLHPHPRTAGSAVSGERRGQSIGCMSAGRPARRMSSSYSRLGSSVSTARRAG
jgi:hypothetical protein